MLNTSLKRYRYCEHNREVQDFEVSDTTRSVTHELVNLLEIAILLLCAYLARDYITFEIFA